MLRSQSHPGEKRGNLITAKIGVKGFPARVSKSSLLASLLQARASHDLTGSAFMQNDGSSPLRSVFVDGFGKKTLILSMLVETNCH